MGKPVNCLKCSGTTVGKVRNLLETVFDRYENIGPAVLPPGTRKPGRPAGFPFC